MHGSDFGLFIHAEVLGARRTIFVKDEDGLYDRDPKKHADAKLIKRNALEGLLANMPQELILDHALFTTWKRARHKLPSRLADSSLTSANQGGKTFDYTPLTR